MPNPTPTGGRRPRHRAALRAAALALTALTAAAAAPAPPATPEPPAALRLAGAGECTFPMKKQIADRPWALQRLLLDALWVKTKGKGVRVAVIDTGVDRVNPQLASAVDVGAGKDYIDPKGGDGTNDTVGHGTKVAGLIAARPQEGTGFVGLAPEATIIPIRQNDDKETGKADTLAAAIRHAIAQKAQVINISQDTTVPVSEDSDLGRAVREAVAADIVVVASAGNDGLDGQKRKTYPAAFPGVLAVASVDRNNERASFSQPGAFIGVAAPGVDMVSTVPGFGQCVDNGTSFSAPYVAGLAALLRAQNPKWTAPQIIWQIEQSAERAVNGRDDYVGWGVVDPVRAVATDSAAPPAGPPSADPGPPPAAAPEAAPLVLNETAQERRTRFGTYALGTAAVLITVIAGAAAVARERRRRRRRTGPSAPG
ncbi:type VII secretion-associated serine protease mycosin [Streptomyces sp. G-G2]|uniref:type VII secretion-associated serine protease mycosin n=1 Tax=Streptomyces sp. G-G2 TaxID=3046201 RepID=UPI0024B8AC08|nr:type VII secretion-associated serine protease mycosin [Streptomyces sp. G-G2]MDJ0386041.1 type VII secretion-associated serine protease mycosin [Streptomyces sp. G-G2]